MIYEQQMILKEYIFPSTCNYDHWLFAINNYAILIDNSESILHRNYLNSHFDEVLTMTIVFC